MSLALLLAVTAVQATPVIAPDRAKRAVNRALDMPSPIPPRPELSIDRMTFPEIRDAVRRGRTTVIVPTGGVEHNGPYLVTAKHRIVIDATARAAAAKLGDALVAPVVDFVPQGPLEPPGGGVAHAGTVGVSEATYRALLSDIARSFRAQGFRHIVFIGDSGGNVAGMEAVARELDARWRAAGVRVLHAAEHYDPEGRRAFVRDAGFREVDEGYHDELIYTAVLLSRSPDHVRWRERRAAGRLSINGVRLDPARRIAALGDALIDDVAERTAAAIRRRRTAAGAAVAAAGADR